MTDNYSDISDDEINSLLLKVNGHQASLHPNAG
jgi:hypothetical protein